MKDNSNNIAYLKLFLSSSFETASVYLFGKDSKNQPVRDLENISLFFIFSFGRTGTQFLSRMLNNDVAASVFHEPAKRDVLEYARSFREGYSYSAYIQGFRKKFIQRNLANKNVRVYGEVNSYLRRHASSIIECSRTTKGLFLIRDGRDVVRSMMSRDVFSDHWFYNRIIPRRDDPYFSKWAEWGPFEKCCWFWASENTLLFNQFGRALIFEKVISDYGYFKANVVDQIHVEVSESTWAKERNAKSENVTPQHKIDSYELWPKQWKRIFWEICGEMMEAHGYA